MKIESTPLHEVKARCEDCWKVFGFEDGVITQARIDMIIYLADKHEKLHPKHSVEVLIYDRAPETIDIGL